MILTSKTRDNHPFPYKSTKSKKEKVSLLFHHLTDLANFLGLSCKREQKERNVVNKKKLQDSFSVENTSTR